MKAVAKKVIVLILSWQVRRLARRHSFKVVAVVGGVGKTSTKLAIASVLSSKLRVRYQTGNYNDIVTVPLVYFGQQLPSLLNPIAWLRVLLGNERQIHGDFPWDVVVLELGTDGPGQIEKFRSFVRADIGVLTAIVPEHMEFFESLDAVAREELSIVKFSDELLVNADLCDSHYRVGITNMQTYGMHGFADYLLEGVQPDANGQAFKLRHNGSMWLASHHQSIAAVQLYSLTAAAAVATMIGMNTDVINKALPAVPPVPGRLQLLKGINGSLIIDDTYNASPEAMKSSLDALYKVEAAVKIALLGNMNELGEYSAQAHTEVGGYCEPSQLQLVVTLGADANSYLADAAIKNGCRVQKAESPYEAALIIKPLLQAGVVLLAKGSQNGVFAEEAVKQLLADPKDSIKLVRQSPEWITKKARQFPPA